MSKTSKRCSKCKESKNIDQFNKHKGMKDGLQSYCKECRSIVHQNKAEHNRKRVRDNYYKKHTENKLKNKERNKTVKARFHQLKNGAQKRSLEVTLTLDEYVKIVSEGNCTYCGNALPIFGSGIDRKNNSEGYTKENSIACCGDCNTIKADKLSYLEMIEVAKLLKRLRNG